MVEVIGANKQNCSEDKTEDVGNLVNYDSGAGRLSYRTFKESDLAHLGKILVIGRNGKVKEW